MKIAIITWWYAKNMGYSENFLPSALAALGHEVHVISSDLQPDFPNYSEAYEPFLGKQQQSCGITNIDGYSLHRLPHMRTRFGIKILGLVEYLRNVNPDIIQCFGIPQMSTYQSAWYAKSEKKPLFLEEHTHLSTLSKELNWRQRLDNFTVKYILGPMVSAVSYHCYAIAKDVADVTLSNFGYSEKKLSIQSLGVDTNKFFPCHASEQIESRKSIRFNFGFSESDIVFIYTGRFSEDKSPIILARAIGILSKQGYPVKGLFIGSGKLIDLQAIASESSCHIVPFMPVSDLPSMYRAADVGVWPKQESTSQLDALACGIPIIISNRVKVQERVNECGLMYEEGSYTDLAEKMLMLLESSVRYKMGLAGAKTIMDNYSWNIIAKSRIENYKKALILF
jgi:glycosyltransferase involved in cell wall biosynthesis